MRDETYARGSTLLAAKKRPTQYRLTRGKRPIPHRQLKSGGDGLFPKRFQPWRLSLWDHSPSSCLPHRLFSDYYMRAANSCQSKKLLLKKQ